MIKIARKYLEADASFVLPVFALSIPLESPQFEKITYFSVIRTHTAVVPLLSSPFATSGIFRSFSSSSKNPAMIPVLTCTQKMHGCWHELEMILIALLKIGKEGR